MSAQTSYSRPGFTTSTAASRWFFRPDHEFLASLGDYAVVQKTSTEVRHAKTHVDNGCYRRGLNQNSFADVLLKLPANPCYSFAHDGQLVYADVDDENAKHKEDVYGSIAEEAPLKSVSDDVKVARKYLIEHLAKKWFQHERGSNAHRCRMAQDRLFSMLRDGEIDDSIIRYIICAPNETKMQVLLNIVSGQSQRSTQRPVLVLIGLIDDMQSTEMGVTKGWKIGYDFMKGTLIIKPFLSTKDKHPLGSYWYTPAKGDDDISFQDTPGTFVTNYAHQAPNQTNVDRNAPQPLAIPAAFKALVHTVAAKWIARHWKRLFSTEENLEAFKKAILSNTVALTTIKFPVTKKTGPLPFVNPDSVPEEDHDASGRGNWIVDAYVRIQDILEKEEPQIRDVALRAKEAGDHYAADRIAGAWSDMWYRLTSINEGPRETWCWDRELDREWD